MATDVKSPDDAKAANDLHAHAKPEIDSKDVIDVSLVWLFLRLLARYSSRNSSDSDSLNLSEIARYGYCLSSASFPG